MEKTITKPKFKETIKVTTIELDDGLVFNPQKVGFMDFNSLRSAGYGKEFRMPTMPELVQLVHASFENMNRFSVAKDIIKIFRNFELTGNTGILYVQDGIYVQDNPNMKHERISMNQKILERKLGSHNEKGVVFSDDRSVRFTTYNFKKGIQTPLELSKNKGIIALVGGEENAEKLAKASEHYRKNPYFLALEYVDSPLRRFAVLKSDSSFDGRLGIRTYGSVDYINIYTFGCKEISTEDVAPEK